MGLIDIIAQPGQKIAYLYPEVPFSTISGATQSTVANEPLQDVFVFQFWPQQIADRYQVNYATKQIPGASHPLYQWTGGGGRTISFDATFVTELAESDLNAGQPFNTRIQADAGALAGTAVQSLKNTISAALLPSSRYVVDVASAVGSLQRYLYGNYNDNVGKAGITEPPRKLYLVLPGTSLGRSKDVDGILCILLKADVTMESFFPTGQPRVATVGLEFAEIIQHTSGTGSRIKYIGSDAYADATRRYTIKGRGFSNVNV